MECRIGKVSPAARSLEVQCRIKNPPAGAVVLRFPDRSAGVSGLDERIYSLKARDPQGAEVKPEILGGGVYRFARQGELSVGYEMRLASAYRAEQHALVSSLGPEAGVLMPGDLLPAICDQQGRCSRRVRVRIDPPNGWTVASASERSGEAFELHEDSEAVFFVGRLRERLHPIAGMNVRAAVVGNWKFSDDEFFVLVESIAREQAAMIGSRETGDFLVTLAPYPQGVSGLRSSARTLGRTVVLMLHESETPATTLAHFRKHLAHEMFHFYLPNAFQIRERIDWFWEGFTRYIALLTLVRLRLVGEQEFLDELSAEYEAYFYNPLRLRQSLIEASPANLIGADASGLVYRKGTLVAALYDLELRRQSRGRESLPSVLQAFYRNFAVPRREIGYQETIAALARSSEIAKTLREDIETAKDIDLKKRIKPFALILEQTAAANWKVRPKDGSHPSPFFVQLIERE